MQQAISFKPKDINDDKVYLVTVVGMKTETQYNRMQQAISFRLKDTNDDKVYLVTVICMHYREENACPDNVTAKFSRQLHGFYHHDYVSWASSRKYIELARKRSLSPFPLLRQVYIADNVVRNDKEGPLMFGIMRNVYNRSEKDKSYRIEETSRLLMTLGNLTKKYFQIVARFDNSRTRTAINYQPQKRTMSQRKIGKICSVICQGRNRTVPLANSEVRKKVCRRNGEPRKNDEESTKESMTFAKPSHVPVQKGGYRYLVSLLMCLMLSNQMVFGVDGSGGRVATQKCYASTMENTRIEELDQDAICQVPELTSTLKTHRNSICPFDDKTIRLLAKINGNYSCMNGYETMCFNGEDRLHFVCLPADIRCPKGFGWNISSDTGGENIEIRLGKCKPGHYQETPSKCVDACRDEHFQPRHIPPGFKIYKAGDNINPQLMMCDFSSGYYNPENKSYIKADSEFTHNFIGFCVDSPNPCSEGQMVLHNRSCVELCENGYKRYAPDFTCKEKLDENDISIRMEDTIPSSFSLESGPSPPPTATTIGPHYAIIDHKKTVTAGILVILGCLFIVFACGVLFLLYKRQGVKPSHYTAEHEHELHDMRPMIGNANGTDETVVHVATENDLGDVTHHNTPLLQD